MEGRQNSVIPLTMVQCEQKKRLGRYCMELVKPIWRSPHSHLELLLEDVHIWIVSFDQLGAYMTKMARYLSSDERARAGRFRFERDRTRFILSHGALRTLLAGYLSADPSQLCFHPGTYGKPRLSGKYAETQIQFSLSRSSRFSLFGFTRCRRIGVDIEEIRSMPDVEHVAALLFSRYEKQVWNRLPAHLKNMAFFSGFVRKEAYVKAMGKGFFHPPQDVEVSIELEEPIQIVRVDESEEGGSRWCIQQLDLADDHMAVLVTENGPCRISCWIWQTTEEK